MIRDYASGATLTVASLHYSGMVFGAIPSLVVFNDQLPLIAWAGIAVIIASGIAASVLCRRKVPMHRTRINNLRSRPRNSVLAMGLVKMLRPLDQRINAYCAPKTWPRMAP